MASWLDKWVIMMGVASLMLIVLAVLWPDHDVLVALASGLAWAAMAHAFYRSRLGPED